MRHRRQVPFEPKLSLGQGYKAMVRQIRSLDEQLGRFLLSADDYLDLVNEAYASNIHWSTKIEGNRLSLDEVRKLTTKFSKGQIRESPNGPVQEILNHLYSVFNREGYALPWDIDTVRRVHRILMTGVGQTEPGVLRTTDVSVVDSNGTEAFIACPAGSVGDELRSLLDWLEWSPFDEVATAAVFFHEFESIHPFEDGNGRTGRTLFHICLQESGLRNCMLCKIEEELVGNTGVYYDLLAYTDSTHNYGPFVNYVAESLLIAYQKAVDEFGSRDRLVEFDENTKHLALMAREVRDFTLSEAAGWIKLTEQSVRGKLEDLVAAGILVKTGRTRGMRYVFNDPFRDLRNGADLERELRAPGI